MDTLFDILNMLGTISFAVSGALIAIRKGMDLLGVIILGMVTAVGGGVIRDLIIGEIPPAAFTDPSYALAACLTSVLVFCVYFFHFSDYHKKESVRFQNIILVSDSVGLALFSVVGVQTAFRYDPECNWFLAVFLGTITGVGGGVIRDLLANEKPYILYRHVYACAAIAGALASAILWSLLGPDRSMVVGAVIVMVIRFLAAHYRWNLPRIQ